MEPVYPVHYAADAMVVVALLTISLAGAPRAAVVDVAPTEGSAALAEALRTMPALRGRALSAAQTELVVKDAAGLGLTCAFDDDPCLQKLLVLARIDELVAFAASADEVRLARATAARVVRSTSRVAGSPAVRARAAWGALQRAEHGALTATPIATGAGEDDEDDDPDLVTPARREVERPWPQLAETPTATSGGVTPPLVVGMAGAGAAVVLGTAAVGVSAALAQQLRGTQLGVPLDDSYDALQVGFWTLSAGTAAALVTGAVGLGWFFVEGGPALSAP